MLGFLKRTTHTGLVFGVAGLLSAAGLQAASLQVTPTLVQFLPNQRAQVLEVENTATTPIMVQARVLRWTQVDGVESLAEDDALIVSPNLVRLAASSKQRLRIILNSTEVSDKSTHAYRILVDEIPVQATNKTPLTLALRYSIPLFFLPSAEAHQWEPKDLQWRLDTRVTPPVLHVRNLRASPAQLADAHLMVAKEKENPLSAPLIIPLTKGLMGYAFADSSHQWTLADSVGQYASVHSISVQVNGQRYVWPIQIQTTQATPVRIGID